MNSIEGLVQNLKNSGPKKWVGSYKEHLTSISIFLSSVKDEIKDQLLYSSGSLHLATPIIDKKTIRELAINGAYHSEEVLPISWLDYIEPELREGYFEIEAAKSHKLPQLAEMSDLKGILHNHSTYSDGKHSLRDMAIYCKELGYEYLGMCDHSKSAFYANGLNEDRMCMAPWDWWTQ